MKKIIVFGVFLMTSILVFEACQKENMTANTKVSDNKELLEAKEETNFNETADFTENLLKQNNLLIDDIIKLPQLSGFVGVILSAKIYRATTRRRRDAKNCGCMQCFGICRVKGGAGVGVEFLNGDNSDDDSGDKQILIKPLGLDKTIIYLPANQDVVVEQEFGIDYDISVNLGAIGNLKQLTFLSGEYNFVEEEGVLNLALNGNEFEYMGYVVVDSTLL